MAEELTEPPRLVPLYGKALAGLVRRRAGETVPETELVLWRVRVDRSRLAEYARVCGFGDACEPNRRHVRLTDTLPPTYPQVLAFPLALDLMTRPSFPFPAAGVVHVANRVELRRPVAVTEPLDLAVHAEGLRPHPRGRQVDLVTIATVDDAEVWRGVSTYLHRSGSGGGSTASGDAPAPSPSAVWRVGAGIGPAYAAVSGDRNPIHLSHLAARAFGFRRRIAHGMWTKARCLAQLAPRLPDAYTVEVAFKAPILLPATVGFTAALGGAGGTFSVQDLRSGQPHLSGKVTRE